MTWILEFHKFRGFGVFNTYLGRVYVCGFWTMMRSEHVAMIDMQRAQYYAEVRHG